MDNFLLFWMEFDWDGELWKVFRKNLSEVKTPTTEVCPSEGLRHTLRKQTASERNRSLPERKHYAEKDH